MCDVVIAPKSAALDVALAQADALVTLLRYPVTSHILDRAPRLRVVGNFAIGVDNIDLQACASRGLPVIHTPDVLTEATAEMALTLALTTARRVCEGERLVRAGNWSGWAPDQLLGHSLGGHTAVVVGHGRIGQAAAVLFRATGMQVETAQVTRTPLHTRLPALGWCRCICRSMRAPTGGFLESESRT